MKSSEKGFHLFNSIIVVIPETIDCIAYNLKVEYLLIVIVFEIFILILNALLNLTLAFHLFIQVSALCFLSSKLYNNYKVLKV